MARKKKNAFAMPEVTKGVPTPPMFGATPVKVKVDKAKKGKSAKPKKPRKM